MTAVGSTNGGQAAGSAGIEYGTEKWLFWGNGGGQRSDDYTTPLGRVRNSFSREQNVSAGFGYYPTRGFFSFNYNFDKRRYGIPVDAAAVDPEVVFLNPRRHGIEFKGGFRENSSFIEAGTFRFSTTTTLTPKSIRSPMKSAPHSRTRQLSFRESSIRRRLGKLSGRFGFWGSHRDFAATGDEALAPPTKHNAFAVFALETLDFERASLQFGGRLENNRYTPRETAQRGLLPSRSFTGFSGAIGFAFPPGLAAPSSPIIPIPTAHPHWKSSITTDHIREIWHSRLAIRILNGNSATGLILDYVIHVQTAAF